MRTRALLGAALATGLLAAGCGSTAAPTSSSAASTKTSSTMEMKGHEGHEGMEGMEGHEDMEMTAANGPSSPASMICTDEIRDAVTRTFALAVPPASTDAWAKSERLYSCDYELPEGVLSLSVHDAADDVTGRSHFDKVRSALPAATDLRGLENLGFPAFSSSAGKVAFLKDGKTLLVDASALPDASLPADYTRQQAAYSVASAVIACWTE